MYQRVAEIFIKGRQSKEMPFSCQILELGIFLKTLLTRMYIEKVRQKKLKTI